MENPIVRTSLRGAKASSPLAALYLVSSLGLLSGAFNVCLAESNPATFTMEKIATQTNAVESVEIPGAQSAVLTVSRELHTTAPIMNHELKGKPPQKTAAPRSSVTPMTAPKYYLELPEPQSTAKPSPISQNVPMPTPATSVPVVPVSSQLLSPASEQAQPAMSPLLLPDPENLPLVMNADTSPIANAATHALIRVTLGLMVVLGLLLVFAKSVLPRLMARHPEFFERLKQKNQSAKEPQSQDSAPLDIPQAILEKRIAKKEPLKLNWPVSKKQQKLEKTQTLGSDTGQIQISGKQFNVLSSTPLGKDKDLHLVEIMGRQLVVATTPYTVSLIQDLTETEQPGTRPANNIVTGDSEKIDSHPLHLVAHDLTDSLSVEMTQDNGMLSQGQMPETTESQPEINCETDGEADQSPCQNLIPLPEEIVMAQDLDDQPPPAPQAEFIRAKSNPYNSVPKFSELRYLNIESPVSGETPEAYSSVESTNVLIPKTETQAAPEGLETGSLEGDSTSHPEAPEATTRTLSPSLEAIVMLADYDDVYGY
jgi:flagellar biogenesis protein FliO